MTVDSNTSGDLSLQHDFSAKWFSDSSNIYILNLQSLIKKSKIKNNNRCMEELKFDKWQQEGSPFWPGVENLQFKF